MRKKSWIFTRLWDIVMYLFKVKNIVVEEVHSVRLVIE